MRLCILFIIILIAPLPVFADGLFVEAGAGIGKSLHSEAVLLRYRKETSRLFNHDSYHEALAAYWNNSTHAAGAGIARGVIWNRRKTHDFSTTFGLMGINRKTGNLGTRLQFYFRMAYGISFRGREVSIGYVHLSNGKLLFGWGGPNNGENFLTVSVKLF